MLVHQIYAQILGESIKNIIICDNYEMANYLARATYGDDAFAADCTQYPCSPGDSYRAGRFWRIHEDGEETAIDYVPTPEEQVTVLERQNTELQLAVAEQYEINLSLQNEVISTQIALADFYEGKEV